MKKILIVNGPNLNLLGSREKTIYGEISFELYLEELKANYSTIQIDYIQSNDEQELVKAVHDAIENYSGIIINPAAYGHTSIALADAIASINIPCIEVHISNIYARESFRHYTLITKNCIGSITGFGLKSYELAMNYFV